MVPIAYGSLTEPANAVLNALLNKALVNYLACPVNKDIDMALVPEFKW